MDAVGTYTLRGGTEKSNRRASTEKSTTQVSDRLRGALKRIPNFSRLTGLGNGTENATFPQDIQADNPENEPAKYFSPDGEPGETRDPFA